VIFGIVFLIAGCGAGSTSPNSIISIAIESGSVCTGMVGGSSCSIVITYNTNGAYNPTLGYTPSPLPPGITQNGTFESSINTCQTTINTSSISSCTVNFTFSANYSPLTDTNIAFILGGTTSNTVYLQGN
jgi:hypothetical protein